MILFLQCRFLLFLEKSAVQILFFAVQISPWICSRIFWFLQCKLCVFAEGESGHAKQTHTAHGADKTRIPQKHAQKIPPQISDKLGFMENPKTGVFLDTHPLDPHVQDPEYSVILGELYLSYHRLR